MWIFVTIRSLHFMAENTQLLRTEIVSSVVAARQTTKPRPFFRALPNLHNDVKILFISDFRTFATPHLEGERAAVVYFWLLFYSLQVPNSSAA